MAIYLEGLRNNIGNIMKRKYFPLDLPRALTGQSFVQSFLLIPASANLFLGGVEEYISRKKLDESGNTLFFSEF